MARIFWVLRHLYVVPAVALMMASAVSAQAGAAANPGSAAIPETVEDVLHQMSDKADIIFAGQVTAIHLSDAGTAASGFVEINFRVDQGIRGCASRGSYTLREWAGLWADNPNRYEVGRRLLMMLRGPGASGMSSPVGGMDGAIPIRGGGAASLLSTASTVSQAPVADLRWLGARLLHSVSYRLSPVMSPTPLTLPQQAIEASDQNLTGRAIADAITVDDSNSADRASVPVPQASVDTVVKLLTSWQKASHEAVR